MTDTWKATTINIATPRHESRLLSRSLPMLLKPMVHHPHAATNGLARARSSTANRLFALVTGRRPAAPPAISVSISKDTHWQNGNHGRTPRYVRPSQKGETAADTQAWSRPSPALPVEHVGPPGALRRAVASRND